MNGQSAAGRSCPGPAVRLAAFLIVYGAMVWVPRDEWPRFFFLLLLAAVLVPSRSGAWRRGARLFLHLLPGLAGLGAMVWLFGTLGTAGRSAVFVDIMLRTLVAVAAAVFVWGGAGMGDFLKGLQQLRAPGVVVSVVALALQSMIRMGRDARFTLDALRSRSGSRISLMGRISLSPSLMRHFLSGVVETHAHLHAALAARGYAGGPLRMARTVAPRGEWLFLPVYAAAALTMAVA